MRSIRSVLLIGAIFVSQGALSFASPPKLVPGTYTIDPSHSKVGFEVPHMVISTVEGRFKTFDGIVVIGETLDKSKVEATVQTASIDTGNEKRDDHLRNEDFFKSEEFPVMTFKSKSISGKADALKVKGDLTLKGVTKEVLLSGKYLGTVPNGKGIPTAAFEGKTKINRKDFGLTYNKLIEVGPAVGDTVTILLKIEANKKP